MGRSAFVGPRMVAVSVLAMTAAFGLNLAAGVFLAPLSAAHGWGVGAVSAAAAVNTVVAGVLQPVVGALVDRFGPRVVLTVSLGLLAASHVALSAPRIGRRLHHSALRKGGRRAPGRCPQDRQMV
jgi:MFS family permease